MTQDKNYTFVKTLRSKLVATMMLMTSGNVMAGVVVTGNVYGGGNEAEVQGNSAVNMSAGTVNENVFGGGNLAAVQGSVTVTISGGTVTNDVYGGGALADTNTDNWDPTNNTWANTTNTSAVFTTTVRLTGGTVRDVYGGGLGDVNTAAYVYGDVLVDLNGTTTISGTETKTYSGTPIPTDAKGCVVGKVFGCNNINGSPKGEVVVYVHATQSAGKDNITVKGRNKTNPAEGSKYDVEAIYGGGNQAEYWPVQAVKYYNDQTTNLYPETAANHIHTNVIIDGCAWTSIETVYGGGNAASSPATSVTVLGAYEINEVFGGGNGKDDIAPGVTNPGAHVGFHKYADDDDKANQKYGFGKAQVNIGGGTIHSVFGGSNSKGNVREIAVATLDDQSDCAFVVGEAYGGGKEAEMDGKAELNLGCIPAGGLVGAVYGGAKKTNVNNDVVLNITNGNFDAVYGGNNVSGKIRGTITVNIEENGCTPIIIGKLFGGGNEAAYNVEDIPKNHPDLELNDATAANYYKNFPKVNVISATRIGQVFGGGDNAEVTGNPHVKIAMEKGKVNNVEQNLGTICQVFGGGNNAGVTGDTYVDIIKGQIAKEVKTAATETTAAVYYYDYDPGVYGGCNTQGTVTGNTYVNVTGGTIGNGTLDPTDLKRTVKGNVFGGGYGKDTFVSGNVEVNIGAETTTSGVYSGDAVIYGDVYGGGALGHVNGTKNESTTEGALPITPNVDATTTVNLNKGTIYGDAYGGGLGDATNAAYVGGTVTVIQNEVAYIIDHYADVTTTTDYDESTIVKSGRIFGCNNLNGYPLGNVNVTVNKTVEGNVSKSTDVTSTTAAHTYHRAAVYGGGNLAPYKANNMKASVRINGCSDTSIETVYGGGNAAAVPETDVLVWGCYEIGTVFGGGNGKDKYTTDGGTTWTANPGANVGKTVGGEVIGNGNAKTILQGGYIHEGYGGSNSKGTISGNVTIKKQDGGECDVTVVHIYGAGKDADVEGDLVLDLGCSTTRTEEVYGCAKNANVKGNVDVIITSGEYGKVFGGNNESGAIFGRIKVHIEETGCTPIIIDELYGCGNDAAYSVYGYWENGKIAGTDKPKYEARTSANDEHAYVYWGNNDDTDHTKPPYADPEVNIVSCTRIGKVFGGGLGSNATVYGNPIVNINQIYGKAYVGDNTANPYTAIATALGRIGVDKDGVTNDYGVFGGGNEARVEGNTTVNIGNLEYVEMVSFPKDDVRGYFTRSGDEYSEVTGNAAVAATANTSYYKKVLGANILSNVFGGGNKADVSGNTFVNICAAQNPVLGTDNKPTGDYTYTPVDHSETTDFEGISIGESVYGGGSEADVKGNTRVTMTDGYVFDGVYGGGLQGSVGTITSREALPEGHSHKAGETCVGGKPKEFADYTGKCTVVISGGQVGPVEVALANGGMKNEGNLPGYNGGPVDVGFVFGAGRGAVENLDDDPDADFHTYVKDTEVTISGTALIMASVYGGGENGRVRGNTKVKIEGGQIGCGVGQIENGKPKRYTDGTGGTPNQFIDPTETPVTETNALVGCATWDYGAGLPYDPLANLPYSDGTTVTDASTTGSDGHTYYGSVFGGGSGYYPYEIKDASNNVIGHDWLESAGLVEGNTEVEITGGHILTSVYGGNELTNVGGTCTVTMSGGTIGVPRTKTQVENNPSIGNIFGAGKGDKRVHFNTWTNVKETIVNIKGGIVYGSVFGGGEDGHVLDNATTKIEEASGKTITIGSTGESGADGNVFGGGRGSETALTAGVVGGNVSLTIESGNILGSVYGGGRLAAVGTNFVNPDGEGYGALQSPEANHGNITVNINGGTIGTAASTGISGNIYGGSKGTATDFRLGIVRSTTINMTGGTAYASVYGGGELAQVMGSHTTSGQALGTEINISGGTIGISGQGSATWGNVFAGGKGNTSDVEAGLVKSNTKVVISETDATNKPTTIYHNIYGGGAYGSVGEFNYDTATGLPTGRKDGTTGGTAYVTITGGTIGIDGKENGMIFGSSRGDVGAPGEIHDKLAWVYDTHVTIGTSEQGTTLTTPLIKGSVYGSGENGHTFNDTEVIVHCGTIGITETSIDDGAAYAYRGNVYGGGCGTDMYDSDNDGTEDSYNALAGVVYGDAIVTIDGGQVVHNVYGAGAMGSVGFTNSSGAIIKDGTTTITITGGKIGVDGSKGDGNVFGAARGDFASTQTHLAQVQSTSVSMSDGTVYGNVYGGGEAGDVGTYTNTFTETGSKNYVWDIISEKEIGACAVKITGGTVKGHVFGAGKGEANTFECEKAIARATSVLISAGVVEKNVYGGGEVGRVDQDSKVTIGVENQAKGDVAPDIKGSVFGAGAGKDTHGYSALVRGNTEVILQGNAKVGKSVYGGGEIAAVGRYGLDGSGMPTTLVSGGECKVTVKGYADIGENVFGAGEGVVPAFVSGESKRMDNTGAWETFTDRDKYLAFLQTLALVTDTKLSIEGNATIKGSVYGGSESGFVQRDTEVKIQGGEIGTTTTAANVYGGGKGLATFAEAGRVSGDVTLAVNGGTTHGAVYGGGELGIVKGGVIVNMTGGTIEKDVYGGGALANTNTDNWDATMNEGAGGWAEGKSSASNTTTVNLLGGTIKGDAYGGGLGRLAATGVEAIEAMVYGDVFVTLGDDDATGATAFNISTLTDNSDATKPVQVVNSGRVFGCNNLNGSPKGDVTVTVNKTVAGNVTRTSEDPNNTGRPPMGEASPSNRSYEVAAVYGGGNLANYVAEGTGRKTNVVINTCDVSIEEVYGGGNAAKVPETNVLVNGAYEIEHVFGGGNGEDKFTLDSGTTWNTNPGADIDGNTNTLIRGGYVHEAYGASNEKGTITGTVTIDTGTGGVCQVQVDKLVAAGKNADVNGDLIVILGCKDATKIPIVYGGADNANVNGNVELTITSGHFGQVFGGNNLGGAIRGHIILNIEETSDCEPIRIDELYLGGNQAAYSKFGYYIKTTTSEGEGATGKGAPEEEAVLTTRGKLWFMPRKSKDDPHLPVNTYDAEAKTWTVITDEANYPEYDDPIMNLISCTEAKEVFGGGYGDGGDMYANPTVNINMIPGKHANTQLGGAHKLGEIGDVYGGGNLASVVGDATINIGTANTVNVKSWNFDGVNYTAEDRSVEGAYIKGNVYGGGKLANVGVTHLGTDASGNTIDVIDARGNTFVNIGAVRGTAIVDSDNKPTGEYNYTPVDITGAGYEGVKVLGHVFGGGKGEAAESGTGAFRCGKAMVTGGTNVCIGNGTVTGFVYGGGEVGRVEENTRVTIGLGNGGTTPASAPIIGGDVFGAGKGEKTHGYSALVRGNTYVTIQGDAKVKESVYGGGEIASVGRYNIANAAYHAEHPEVEVGMPYSLKTENSGYCYVTVRGNAEIGPDTPMLMTRDGGPDDTGHVIGAGKGVLPYEGITGTDKPGRMKPDNTMEYYTKTDYVPSGTETYEEAYLKYIESLGLATHTDVTIGGNAFVKGSVYGGSLNGHVQHDTHVTIEETCQIGAGEGETTRFTATWPTETENISTSWKECAHWDYNPLSGAPYDPYAKYVKDGKYYYDEACTYYAEGGSYIAKDGHTYYGNVFGGGSGVIPYAPGKWHRAAGSVGGNTVVDIKGGHILTSVYGGNEQTDVGTYMKDSKGALVIPVSGGKCTINMTGGTVGVPRTEADAKAHPVTCYLFGAGKGDQRIFFNTWTNVINTEVNISGDARIYGSTFGGGEDGHVIEDAKTTISGTNVIIGTTGTSYVDGNVFGGGRGFSGDAQTAGTVGGNVQVNISDGKMLGSIYGGGRLASVGTQFTAPDDPNYGVFLEDKTGENAKTYGHVTVNISGGTIGNGSGNNVKGDADGKVVSGNVFGGSMGRLKLLDGITTNPIWPKMAQVKSSTVTISDKANIKRTVFGGGELGSVRDNATVNISGGTVGRDVYGAGYGSDDYTTKTKITVKEPKAGVTNPSSLSDYDDVSYVFTPMIFAGCVGQNTYVNISGGQVKKSVYGGGEMASVGVIDCRVKIDNSTDDPVYTDATGKYVYEKNHKHNHEDNDFILSWPYHFENREGYYGETHVNITGGRIGLYSSQENTFEDKDNGDVCGGGKGIAGDFNNYVFCANVGSSEVTINYPSNADPQTYEASGDCIAGAVYGGAENGHVMGNTKLTLKKGLIGHSIYGGGSGKGKFTQRLLQIGKPVGSTSPSDSAYVDIYSVTAGKVFGNTEIIMEDGYVVRNVYGGGNLGSVGKGNYAGGPDDYSTTGYGEKISGANNLWSDQNPYGEAFLKSGKSSVTITGGTVGYIDFTKVSDYTYSGLPYGNVFGGCRGESAPNIFESPRYLYCPTFFSGYVNETDVTIGAAGSTTGPKIWGSVYGGGMDGHVRRDANVTINSGEIGRPYTGDGSDLNNVEWLYCGNVFGAGSGIGQYKYDFNYDGDYSDEFDYTNPLTGSTSKVKETDYSTSAGSVTRFTKVEIKGGTIHRNVYGGGSLSSIGAPKIGQSYNLYQPTDQAHSTEVGKQTLNEVIISGGNIGDAESHAKDYGGHVFGGSRGDASLDNSTFSTSMFTKVNMGGGKVLGSVFGGGEVGIVKGSVAVNVTGGEVESDIYGGGALANTNTENPKDADGKLTSTSTYTTTVNLLGGTINDAFGGGLGQKKDVNGDSNIEAKVFGDVTVNLNGLEPADYVPAIHSALVTDVDDTEGTYYRATGGCVVTGDVFGCNNYNGTPEGHAKVHVFKTVPKPGQAADGYDVDHVFGGGNDADYTPAASDTKQSTEVIIEGCDLTSIYQVYGGGNAAASPGTSVLVKGTKIIYEVFGGGNGESTETFENPGANVGYHTDKTEYTSGDGKSQVQLMAGNVTYAYGGSNSHGNIRGGSSVTNVTNEYSAGCCDKMTVQEIYAGGKNADMEGGAKIVMGCTNSDDWVEEVYAGAKNANVGGDVSLTLTSGKFGRVFGGNKESGILDGSITVNIEENAKCGVPLIIGELYGGGNKAAYSIYGYNADGTVKTSGEKLHASPVVNVRAFTSIGNIFGGGYGEKAVMYGSPTININVVNNNRTTGSTISTELTKTFEEGTDNEYSVKIPTHVDGKIGAINNVFGGGNAAKIYGDTNVNIGTEAKQKLVVIKDSGDPDYESDGVTPKTQEMDVVGADIRGNVYGGGNKAEVTGNTNVVIGKQSATSVTP